MSVDGGIVWATVLFVLRALSDYNLRFTTTKYDLDRHLQGRVCSRGVVLYIHLRAARDSKPLQGLLVCVAPPWCLYV